MRTELYTHSMADVVHVAIRMSHAQKQHVACAIGTSCLRAMGTSAHGAEFDVVAPVTIMVQDERAESEAVPLFRRPTPSADSRHLSKQAFLGA